MKVEKLPIAKIKRDTGPQNANRQESLRNRGQLLPISVAKNGSEVYELLDGRRRIEDTLALDGEEILAVVYEDLNEEEKLLRALALNMTRSASPMIEARRIKRLLTEFKWTQRRLAKELDITQGKISQYVALLDKLIPFWQQQLELELITFTVARVLCRLSPQAQEALIGQDVTEASVNGYLRNYQAQAVNLGDLGTPDQDEPVYASNVFISNLQMEAVINGETIEVSWQGRVIRLAMAERGRL